MYLHIYVKTLCLNSRDSNFTSFLEVIRLGMEKFHYFYFKIQGSAPAQSPHIRLSGYYLGYMFCNVGDENISQVVSTPPKTILEYSVDNFKSSLKLSDCRPYFCISANAMKNERDLPWRTWFRPPTTTNRMMPLASGTSVKAPLKFIDR